MSVSSLSSPIPLEVTSEDIVLATREYETRTPMCRCCAVVQSFRRTYPSAAQISCGIRHLDAIIDGLLCTYALDGDLRIAATAFPKTALTRGTLTLTHTVDLR